jgi:uncharacterized protein YjbJ (UPF0337 family)
MNWDRVRGEAKQLGGLLKQKWAKLTDDDLLLLEGKKEVFLGRLQQRSGLAKDEVEKQFDALLSNLDLEKKHPGVIHLGAS